MIICFSFLLAGNLIKFLLSIAVVNTTQIGLAMINAMLQGYEKKILGPKDILNLSQK